MSRRSLGGLEMKSLWIALSLLLTDCFVVRPAFATESGSIQVSQPCWGGQHEIITATYILTNPWGYPIELAYTTSPNCVMVQGTSQNANAAALFGLKVRLVERAGAPPRKTYDDFRGYGVFGDTARAVFDVSSPDTSWENFGNASLELASVVDKTFDCLLLNARRQWPAVKYLHLEIEGSSEFEKFEGTHSLEKVPDLMRNNRWSALQDSLRE